MDTQVTHRNSGATMIIALTQHLKANSINGPLNITEGFSEGMGAVIARQVDRSSPFFHEFANCLGLKRSVSFAAFEKKIRILGLELGQVCLEAFVYGLIDHQNVCFAGFAFFDGNPVARLQMPDILDSQAEQINRSKAVIDAHGKEQMITGTGGQYFGNRLNVLEAPNGFHGNAVSFLGVVVFFHDASIGE